LPDLLWSMRELRGGLFAAVVCCILTFGLWPFGRPRNDVTWVVGENAVRLGKHATLLGSRPLPPSDAGSCRIEMWLRPSTVTDSGTLLGFYGERGATGLSVHQWRTGLQLFREPGGTWRTGLYVDNVFHAGDPVLVSVAAGPAGTVVYVNGSPVCRSPGYHKAIQQVLDLLAA
jgi:hypothetical protein